MDKKLDKIIDLLDQLLNTVPCKRCGYRLSRQAILCPECGLQDPVDYKYE